MAIQFWREYVRIINRGNGMTTEITIQEMRVCVPRDGSLRSMRDGEALAKNLAQKLGQSLALSKEGLSSGTIGRVRVSVPRKQHTTESAASTVNEAIRSQLSSTRRQR
jgi:hypothetical protein